MPKDFSSIGGKSVKEPIIRSTQKIDLSPAYGKTGNQVADPPADDMNDPDLRYRAAQHEAGHAVISEMLNPGTVDSMGLSESGGKTMVRAPHGKQTVQDLSQDELRDMIATSLAGGLTEPGGTTVVHASGDAKNRGTLMGPAANTLSERLSRLITGGGGPNDPMLQNNETLASGRARVAALLADPAVHQHINNVATSLADKGNLTGDEVRSIISQTSH